ncbi:MAG: MBL fold metallo-hydrolase [Clostridia bacterium]|nr:MBL fold metallo-hydrolase [Clostridia bacterium]
MEKCYENKMFRADEVRPGIYKISQPWFRDDTLHANAYLILGEKAAVVYDTMFGYGNLRAFCEEITDLPLILINSHFHGDHAAGDFDFDFVYIHPFDLPGIYNGFHQDAQGLLEAARAAAKPEFAPQLALSEMCVPKPMKTYPIYDGDLFDLGDRKLEVVHVGGHSPGCIVLLDPDRKIAFSGDTCNDNTIISRYPCDSLEEYYVGMQHLKERVTETGIEYFFGGHFSAGVEIVDEMFELLDAIFAGKDDHVKYELNSPFKTTALYAAKMEPMFHRVDGKSANIQYAEDTVRRRPYEPRVLTEKNPGARRVKDNF